MRDGYRLAFGAFDKPDAPKAQALKPLLIDRDLTQGDFAKTLGISTSYFSELLNGRKSISLKILFSIAEETGIDIHELVIEVYE